MQAPTQIEQNITDRSDQNGYVMVGNKIQDLTGEMRNHVDWLMEKNPGTRPEALNVELITKDPFWVRLISDERLLKVASQFIGPQYCVIRIALHRQTTVRRNARSMASRRDLLAVGTDERDHAVAGRRQLHPGERMLACHSWYASGSVAAGNGARRCKKCPGVWYRSQICG